LNVLKPIFTYKKPTFSLLLVAVLCILYSCGSSKTLATPKSTGESPPKIIFLNYSIKKTENGTRNIRFINKVVADGKLKNNNSNETGISGDLICFQLDKKSNELQRIIVKNPLSKSMEFLDESKSFQRKQIDLDSTQFSIRLQLKPNTKYISIGDFSIFETQKKPLIKTEIN
jgi:hypothetical protein